MAPADVASFGMLPRNSNHRRADTCAAVLEIAAEGKGDDAAGQGALRGATGRAGVKQSQVVAPAEAR